MGIELIVIGISTGGSKALKFLIPQFAANFPIPVVIVQHLPVGEAEWLALRLDLLSQLHVVEAKQGDILRAGVVFIAPGGKHLTLSRQADGTVLLELDTQPANSWYCPSVDVLFDSAAEIFGDRLLGIVMTGMGKEGKKGAGKIKASGGKIFTEHESSCIVYSMPREVVEAGLSDRIVSLEDLASVILEELN
ncbi:MAG: chemotaxis protein CheB [Gomphosphaeria aponina SAG 52.96 = DSM 107014]|uniref:protein-glutamate methylesterase n=1 Tax=Gomphosphaeria aponina SAG 52.96 = DSM 107014 TaxID=1521640 RepID=A0A941GRQ3_9CHRO|nr:chemotaxis protein CheB [Gomphosphaeria aponina SAG 52.96 = DSM 107014]